MARKFCPSFKVLKHSAIVIVEPDWLTTRKGRRLISRLLGAGITCAVLK